MKTFKKLLLQIVQVQSTGEFYNALGDVNIAFQRDKISFEDYQLLHRVADLRRMTIDE